MSKAGAAKNGWRDTRRADMRAKLHNKRTRLRRHDLTTTDLDRQTQSSTTATGLEVHRDHRHRASEVSRASKTNSRAAEPVCYIFIGDIDEQYLRKFATVSGADKTFGLRDKVW